MSAAWRGAWRGSGGEARWLAAGLAVDAAGAGVPGAVASQAAGQPHALLYGMAAALAWPAVRALRGGYAGLSAARGARGTLVDWLLLLGVLAAAGAVVGGPGVSSAAVAGLVCAPLLTAAFRQVALRRVAALRRAAYGVRRVLVVGEPGGVDQAVAQLAARAPHAYAVAGVVPVGSARLESAAPVAGRLDVLAPAGAREDAAVVLRAAREKDAELVLVAPGSRFPAERVRRLSWWLHDAGLPVALAPGLVDVQLRRVRVDDPAGLVLLHIAPPVRHGPQVRLKSALDRTAAALGLLLLAPVFFVLAALIRVTSPGPVFHRQVRCGRHRTPFTMWKFRTMVADAEERKAELVRAGANEHDGLMFKMRHDPRVTAVGRFLRRTSLDELPQLLNVLRGEMSLVGPRPPLPDEVDGYDEVALRRLAVKPGITGLWQVSGRSELTWDETLALDLRYVDNWSLAGDLEVMSRTLRAVVDGRGAY